MKYNDKMNTCESIPNLGQICICLELQKMTHTKCK